MELSELIAGLPGVRMPRGVSGAVRICDITEDSRTAMPGSLFIARSGLKADGRSYITDALQQGAAAILTDAAGAEQARAMGCAHVAVADDVPLATAAIAERFYKSPSRALAVVGVTGTNGKSTIAHFTQQILSRIGCTCGLIGTIEIDDGRQRADAYMTTPPATELSRTLSLMVENGCTALAIEASSHALYQRRVAGIAFDVGIFTNLTGDHLDYHGSMESYADAKALLFESLPPGGLAIVNSDDAAHARMLRDCGSAVLTCSHNAGDADISASIDYARNLLTVHGPWGELCVPCALIGQHNAMNAAQAIAAAWHVADRPSTAVLAEASAGLTSPRGRLEPVHEPGAASPLVYVDYAHTDDALAHASRAVRAAHAERTLWVVFGAGGDRDNAKRPRMGAIAGELADRVIVTSDNPRTERPSAIIDEIVSGIDAEHRSKVTVHADRSVAIAFAVREAGEQDVVLIAGKGHEREQVLPDGQGGTITVPFDDCELARAALQRRSGVRA
ncbi:MAG: UDP-N-acetylmuramoyl-L-alanyl-D-glutamate--2,6-diaminopimelate ligase [Planctomycetota bacterium]